MAQYGPVFHPRGRGGGGVEMLQGISSSHDHCVLFLGKTLFSLAVPLSTQDKISQENVK